MDAIISENFPTFENSQSIKFFSVNKISKFLEIFEKL